MKKSLLITTLLTAFIFIISGCSSNTASKSSSSGSAGNAEATGSPEATIGEEQPPEGASADDGSDKADLFGEVSSISDTEITLKIASMPSMPNSGDAPKNDKPSGQPESSTAPSADDEKNAPENNDDKKDPDQAAPSGKNFELNYTGESKTIKVSSDVTVSLLSRKQPAGSSAKQAENQTADSSAKQTENQTLSLKDISVGDIIEVWCSDEDGTAAAKISIFRQADETGK